MLVHMHLRVALCKLGKQTPVFEMSKIKMACNQDSSVSQDHCDEKSSFPLFQYAKKLQEKVRKRYLDKIERSESILF